MFYKSVHSYLNQKDRLPLARVPKLSLLKYHHERMQQQEQLKLVSG